MKLLFLVLLLILTGFPQAAGADLTVAVVKSEGTLPYEEVISGFKAELQNQSLKLVFLQSEQGKEQLEKKITLERADLIFCIGTKALENTSHIVDIPKIFSMITYAGIQVWLNHQDIYGVTLDHLPLYQFKLLRQIFPDRRRIAVLYDPVQNQAVINEAKKGAKEMGFSLMPHPVRSVRDIPQALHELHKNEIDFLWAIYDSVVYRPESARYILMQSLRKGIPLIGFSPQFAGAGAILALYGNYRDMGRQAGLQAVAAIHRGGSGERIVSPRKVRIAINRKAADALGIVYPPPFLKMVDQSY